MPQRTNVAAVVFFYIKTIWCIKQTHFPIKNTLLILQEIKRKNHKIQPIHKIKTK